MQAPSHWPADIKNRILIQFPLAPQTQNANILFNVRRNAETYLFTSKAARGGAADKRDVLNA